MIYFITQNNDYIKIGYTERSAELRLTELQIGNPHELELSLTRDGNEGDEKQYHSRFAAYYVRGEWFFLSSEIKAFIRLSKAEGVGVAFMPTASKR